MFLFTLILRFPKRFQISFRKIFKMVLNWTDEWNFLPMALLTEFENWLSHTNTHIVINVIIIITATVTVTKTSFIPLWYVSVFWRYFFFCPFRVSQLIVKTVWGPGSIIQFSVVILNVKLNARNSLYLSLSTIIVVLTHSLSLSTSVPLWKSTDRIEFFPLNMVQTCNYSYVTWLFFLHVSFVISSWVHLFFVNWKWSAGYWWTEE